MRQIFLLAGFVKVFEIFPGGVLVLCKVEIPAHGYALQFLYPVRKMEGDVCAGLCVVRELLFRVDVFRKPVRGYAD